MASPSRIGLLSIEQAMADYIAVIRHIQEEFGMVGAPVVCLGGSYSGKLSAYMRLKCVYNDVFAVTICGIIHSFPVLEGTRSWYRWLCLRVHQFILTVLVLQTSEYLPHSEPVHIIRFTAMLLPNIDMLTMKLSKKLRQRYPRSARQL